MPLEGASSCRRSCPVRTSGRLLSSNIPRAPVRGPGPVCVHSGRAGLRPSLLTDRRFASCNRITSGPGVEPLPALAQCHNQSGSAWHPQPGTQEITSSNCLSVLVFVHFVKLASTIGIESSFQILEIGSQWPHRRALPLVRARAAGRRLDTRSGALGLRRAHRVTSPSFADTAIASLSTWDPRTARRAPWPGARHWS